MRLYGLNILTGMAITARHFIQTYVEDFKYWFGHKERENVFRNQPETIGSFTVQYPEEKLKVPERFRVLPVLIYEADNGDVRCTACGICAKVCPPQCIWIVQAKGQDGKPKPKANDFFIDMDVCMNCGFCSEFCPFDAIKMDHQFELSNYERKRSHVYDMQDLLVSTEYYGQTHPRAWAKELAVKEEEEKKRKAKEAAAAAAAKKKAEEAAKAAAGAGINPVAAAQNPAAQPPKNVQPSGPAPADKSAAPAAKPAPATPPKAPPSPEAVKTTADELQGKSPSPDAPKTTVPVDKPAAPGAVEPTAATEKDNKPK